MTQRTPEEIRVHINQLRDWDKWQADGGSTPPEPDYSEIADALEYLLQYAEWPKWLELSPRPKVRDEDVK